ADARGRAVPARPSLRSPTVRPVRPSLGSHASSGTGDPEGLRAAMPQQSRIAIITGAANGIGRATAQAFGEAGYHVVGWDLDEANGAALVDALHTAGASAEFAKVDVRSSDSVEAAVAAVIRAHGRVDVLINNAGILRDGQLVKVRGGTLTGKLSEADFDA